MMHRVVRKAFPSHRGGFVHGGGGTEGTMKAVRLHSRGGTEAVVFEDAPVPRLRPGDALVRVHAAGITPTEFTWNSTFTTKERADRLPTIPAFEVSGVVEEVAPGVREVAPGQEVYGLLDFWRDGAAAEHVAVHAADLAPKPRSLDHVHSAAVPLSGLTAWQGLHDHAGVAAGSHLLVQGAAGGVGVYAVQLAHLAGARVAATASARNAAFLRELGAESVIDYTAERFEDRLRDLDVVLDTVGGDTLERSWQVLRKGGVMVTIAGDAPEEKASSHGVRGVSMLVEPNRKELTELARLIDSGALRPVVEAVYPLSRAREAYERGLLGHNRGKLVLQVSP